MLVRQLLDGLLLLVGQVRLAVLTQVVDVPRIRKPTLDGAGPTAGSVLMAEASDTPGQFPRIAL
jgi:hypothetical protein